VRGKLCYFAPELLRGEKATHHTDQFAAGVILWEMISGRPLFEGSNEAEILEKIRRCEISAPSPVGGPLSAELTRVVSTMLAPTPERRFATTAHALAALLDAAPSRGRGPLDLARFLRSIFVMTEEPTSQPNETSRHVHAGPAPLGPVSDVRHVEADTRRDTSQDDDAPTAEARASVTSPPIAEPMAEGARERNRLARIPNRFKQTSFVPGFSAARLATLFDAAIERHRKELESGAFRGSFEDWQEAHAQRGLDVVSGRPLPRDWTIVARWPRFTDVGWERPLGFNWHGSTPWGDDGYWIAEDAIDDEMMVVFEADLGRDEFTGISRGQWEAWWRAREVDPRAEMPGGSRLPISRRARLLLGPDGAPPRTKREWHGLVSRGAETPRRRTSPVELRTEAEKAMRTSLWQKLVNAALGRSSGDDQR
jgi:hypothetical protein